jgi:hypothetical protein
LTCSRQVGTLARYLPYKLAIVAIAGMDCRHLAILQALE